MLQNPSLSRAEQEIRARQKLGKQFLCGERIARVTEHSVRNVVTPETPRTMHSIDFVPADDSVGQAPNEKVKMLTVKFLDQLDDIVASGTCYNSTIIKDILHAARPPDVYTP